VSNGSGAATSGPSSGALRWLVVFGIAIASPAALVLDLIARRFVLSGQPEEVTQFLAVEVTRFAWFAVPGPLIGGLLGWVIYPRMRRWAIRRIGPEPGKEAQAAQRADLEALLTATTCAQAPALLGDVSVMLGARLAPAICTTSCAVAAVLALAAATRSQASS
jgi:hypothetical protein